MKYSALTAQDLPDAPGVYLFRRGQEILYIGKATSLRDRVKSYFRAETLNSRGPRISQMVERADRVSYEQTDSALEALILEAELIKRHQPPYNAREKDNKSFNYVIITDEPYPRVLTVRGRELAQLASKRPAAPRSGAPTGRSSSVAAILRRVPIKRSFGPFASGGALQEGLKLIRRIFPYRGRRCVPRPEQKDPANPQPCFDHQLGLCPGVCVGAISQREYQRYIRHISLFFQGRKKALLKKLEREMAAAAKKQEFERAAELRQTIYALEHINDTAVLTRDFWRRYEAAGSPADGVRHADNRLEAYDIAHLAGTAHTGVMTVLEDGQPAPAEYRTFRIQSRGGPDDTGALREVLKRRLGHPEWPYPGLIVVDGARAQKNAAEAVLREYEIAIPVVAVRKDERHKPQDIIGREELVRQYESSILLANSEAHRFALNTHRRRLRRERK